jgi:hypothetical protein
MGFVPSQTLAKHKQHHCESWPFCDEYCHHKRNLPNLQPCTKAIGLVAFAFCSNARSVTKWCQSKSTLHKSKVYFQLVSQIGVEVKMPFTNSTFSHLVTPDAALPPVGQTTPWFGNSFSKNFQSSVHLNTVTPQFCGRAVKHLSVPSPLEAGNLFSRWAINNQSQLVWSLDGKRVSARALLIAM